MQTCTLLVICIIIYSNNKVFGEAFGFRSTNFKFPLKTMDTSEVEENNHNVWE